VSAAVAREAFKKRKTDEASSKSPPEHQTDQSQDIYNNGKMVDGSFQFASGCGKIPAKFPLEVLIDL